ncbi:MAG TPA: PQQ-binding-like beta-propeller repeat protein [Pyrinomonadaceae bacterium]|nr:PQQ-binding-like beta-propeller repeat protein [Pyrinomonadaceae bacterium]
MRHQTIPRARLLSFIALSALALNASAPAQTAQKKGAASKSEAQKKRPEKVKPGKTLLPEAQKLPDAGLKPVATQVPPSILVRWQGKPGVNRYRLQLATDEKFEDVVFDKAVEGRQYVVKDLPPGNYFWRVAPAAAETSIVYSAPERVNLGTEAKVEVASVVLPADAAGWRTATGEVTVLTPATLRPGGVIDFVGVGADGRVFAVDGASGISLWTARYSAATAGAAASQAPSDKRVTFAPLVIGDAQRGAKVVVATQGGVRALQGDTGRELWRASLEGRASAGVATDVDGDGTPEAVVMTQDPAMFYVVNAGSGQVLSSQKLSGEVSGAPCPFASGGKRGVIVAYRNGRIELRGADGAVVSESKLDGELTTPPLVAMRGEMPFLVVGSNDGLWAFSMPELRALGAIKADDDSARGTLAAADVDGDGSSEIVMVTKRGRVALVSTTDGNVRWFAEGATEAAAAAFADVNGDGVLDVIVPGGGTTFALAFSGRDGSLVMKVEEGGKATATPGGALRSLVVTPALGGGGLLVGGDPGRIGLRAVELPKGSVKTASK